MNSQPSTQQDPAQGTSAEATMQELKGALQSAIIPLAGAWVAAGKALISGMTEASLSEKPLETWEELKSAAKEAIEPLVDAMKHEHETGEQPKPSEPIAVEPATAGGAKRAKPRDAGTTKAAKTRASTAKKRAAVVPSRNRAPRAKAS